MTEALTWQEPVTVIPNDAVEIIPPGQYKVGETLDWQLMLDEAVTTPGNTFDVYTRLYPYSFLNCLLLRLQGARGPVANFDRWKSVGRHVLRGETAMTIVRPISLKRNDDEGNEVVFRRYKQIRSVFDYRQTGGDELVLPEVPGWSLENALGNLALTMVEYDAVENPNMQGYSYERNIAVSPIAVNGLKTILHEGSHVLGGHTTQVNLAKYQEHRGTYEAEAELPAYLVLKELDMMTERQDTVSRGYVQGWLGDDKLSEHSIRTIFSTTDKWLGAGRVAIGEYAA